MKGSKSEYLVLDREISKRKVEWVELSDSERSAKEEENRSVTENSRALSDSGGDSGNGEEIQDNLKKKEGHRGKSNSRLKLNVGKGKHNSRVAMGTEEQCEEKLEGHTGRSDCRSTEDVTGKKLPEVLDEKNAKLACDWLEEHCEELAIVGEILTLRARRCLNKKVGLKAMTNPKNVDKLVNSLQLLMKLAGENLEQIGGFLSLHHKYWIKRVMRHRPTETVADVSISNQPDYEDKTKKSVIECSKDDGNVSEIVLGSDDIESKSLTENQFDDNEIGNRETGTQESDNVSADSLTSAGMSRENSMKRKLQKEGTDSDDRDVVSSAEHENSLQKSVVADKKRRKLEVGLEKETRECAELDADVIMSGTDVSDNCKGDMESAMETSSEQINMDLKDVSEENKLKAICTNITEDAGNIEHEEVSDRKKGFNVESAEKEEAIVAERRAEDLNLPHEAADRVALSETGNCSNSDTLYEVDDHERNFESITTLHYSDNECTFPEGVVADVPIGRDNSSDLVEEAIQENQSKMSDEQNYAKSCVKSEGNNAGVAAMGEGSISKENGNVSDSDSISDATTIEFLSDNACEKGVSDEDYDHEKNEKGKTVESLADDLVPDVKELDREVETDEDRLITVEVPDSVESCPLATAHSDVSRENMKEPEIQNYIAKENEDIVETNRIDTHDSLKKDCENECVEKMKQKRDEEGKSTDNGRLEMSDDMPKCEGQVEAEEKDKVIANKGDKSSDIGETEMSVDIAECEEERNGEEFKVKVNENETAGEDVVEDGTAVAFRYTAECMKAKQTLLEYTTDDDDDDDDSCTDTLLKKKERKEQLRTAKREGVAGCKGKTSAKKWLIGPKSRTQKFKETASASVSSETDESECSSGRQVTDVDRGRKKKFKLKDTEAYKQDEKLRWKCTVIVDRMPNEVFQEHYEHYYSDGEEESEKEEKDDKIDR
jgi:hypothetical protein